MIRRRGIINLDDIQASYGFKKARWDINGELIDTEKGTKRPVVWPEENTVKWHIKWRDRLHEKTGILSNRMIQNVHGERVLLSENGWITLHDEVTSLFSYRGLEREMGRFIGNYYSNNLEEENVTIIEQKFDETAYRALKQPTSIYEEPIDPFVDAIRKESLIRISKANRLWDQHSERTKLPTVSPIRSLDQGKLVYGRLFWQHTNGLPERGYASMRRILSEWLQRYGQSSLFLLLSEVDKYFPLQNEKGLIILAECLSPWEFIDYMNHKKDAKGDNELAVWKEKLTYQWETSRALVKSLSEWLDVTPEKVSV